MPGPEPLPPGPASPESPSARAPLLARAAPAVLFATLALTALGDAAAVLGPALRGAAWRASFLALYQPSYWKYAVLFTGALALFVLDLATPRGRGHADAAGPATARTWPLLLLLFVALHFLAALVSVAPALSWRQALRTAVYAVWALTLFRAARLGAGRRLLAAFLAALLVDALADAGLLLAFARLRGQLPGRGAFIGGNANMLAELMLLAILPGLGLLVGLERGSRGGASPAERAGLVPAAAIAAVLVGLALILASGLEQGEHGLLLNLLTETEGAKIALLAGLAALGIANLPRRLRPYALNSAIAVVLIFACLLLAPPVRRALMRRVHRTSAGVRYYGAAASARMIAERPVLGSGPGTYIVLAPGRGMPEKWLNRYSRRGVAAHPHNELLLLAVELGVPGALLGAALVAVAVLACLRRADALEGRLRAAEAGLARGLACGLLAASAAQLVDVSLRFQDFAPHWWAALGLAAGVGAASEAPVPFADEPAGRRALRTGAAAVLAALAFAFILVPDVRAQRDLVVASLLEKEAAKSRQAGDEEAALERCGQAAELLRRAARSTACGRVHLRARAELAEALLWDGRPDRVEEARAQAEALLGTAPGEVSALHLLSLIARRRGETGAELGCLVRWLRLRPYTEPTSPRSPLWRILLLLSKLPLDRRIALLEGADFGEGRAGAVGRAYCLGLSLFYARAPEHRDPRAAEAVFRRLCDEKDRPGPWPVEREFGRMFIAAGVYDRAFAALQRYVEDRPDDAGGYVLRAEARLGLGSEDRAKAIEDLEEALFLDPQRKGLRSEIRRLRSELGTPPRAVPPPPAGAGYPAPAPGEEDGEPSEAPEAPAP